MFYLRDSIWYLSFLGVVEHSVKCVNVMCLVLMVCSLVAAVAPMVNEYCCKKRKKQKDGTKVKPKEATVAASDAEKVRNWTDWSEESVGDGAAAGGAAAGGAAKSLMLDSRNEPRVLDLGDGPLKKNGQGLKRKKTTRQELRDIRREHGTESEEYQVAVNNMR